jgi:hypothetical protein
MDAEDRFSALASHVEISRKRVAVWDAKTGFIAALDLSFQALPWSGAKILDGKGVPELG